MSKKVLGILSVMIVVFATLFFFYPSHQESKPATEKKVEKNVKPKQEKKATDGLPKVSRDDWNLLLVNADHPVKTDKVDLIALKNGYEIEKRVYNPYYAMEEAAKKAGFSLTVVSSYRSIEYQKQVYQENVNLHLAQGMSEEEAEKKTAGYMTKPGNSEHHTGLALDVVDQDWYDSGNGLEEEFCDTDAGKWIDKNAPKFGFIVRYPKAKEAITGINYEPWHLRYVGPENAKYMYQHDLTLEEYLESLKKAGK